MTHGDAQGRAPDHRPRDGRGHGQADPGLHRHPRGRVPQGLPVRRARQRRSPARTAGWITWRPAPTSRCGCGSRPRATAPRTDRSSASATTRAGKQDFRLQPSQPVTGTVVDAARQARGRRRKSCWPPRPQSVKLGRTSDERTGRSTDAAGRFEFPDPGEPWAVVAAVGRRDRHRRVPGRPDRRRHACGCGRGRRSAASSATAASRSPGPRSSSARSASTASTGRGSKPTPPGRDRRGRSLRVPAGAARAGRASASTWGRGRTRASAPGRACRWTSSRGRRPTWTSAAAGRP